MKTIASLLLLAASLFAQSTPPGQTTNPVQKVNVQWVNGIAPGYWPQKVSGLNLAVGAGLVNCDGAISTYAGGTLAVPDNATSYGYLNPTSGCTPTISTTQPSCGTLLFAKIVAASGQITGITDMRLAALYCPGGNPGNLRLNPNDISFGSVQSGQVSFPVNLTISNTGDGSVIVTGATLSGDPFSSPSLDICNTTIEGLSGCSLPLTCAPSTAGAVDGTLTLTSTAAIDPSNPLVVNLHCTGTSGVTYPLSFNCAGTGSGTVTSDETPPLISFICNAGSISGVFANNYASSHVTTLTPTANSDSTFAGFSGCGLTAEPWECTVSAATTVTATFNLIPVRHTLNVTGSGQGTGTVTSNLNDVLDGDPISCTSTSGTLSGKCFATFNASDDVTLTESPASSGTGTCVGGDCTFGGWAGVSCTPSGTTCHVIMNQNTTVSAGFSQPASGTWALVQHPAKTNCSAGTSCTLTLTQNTGANNLLVAIAHQGNFDSVLTSLTNGCTSWVVSPTHAYHINKSDLAYCLASDAGAGTIVFNFSQSQTPTDITVFEYSNASGALFDTSAIRTNTTCTTCLGVNLTLSGTNDVIVQWLDNANAVTVTGITGGAGYTDPADFPGASIGAQAGAINTTDGSAPSWVQNAASGGPVGAIAFKSSSSTGTSYTFSVACGPNGSGTVTASGISLTCTNGIPSGNGQTTVAPNSTLTLAAQPLPGSSFVNYSGAGCSTNPTCITSAITTNTQVTVNFAQSGTTTYYIATTGSNSNPCTQASPCLTINSVDRRLNGTAPALAKGASGTTIDVACGTYAGPISTIAQGTASARIVWKSHTNSVPGTSCAVITNADWQNGSAYSDVVGFDLSSSTGWCHGISHNSSPLPHDIHVMYNYCHDVSVGTQCRIGGAFWVGGTQPTSVTNPPPSHHNWFIGNIIRHIGNPSGNTAGATCYIMSGIYSHGGAELFENNIISGAMGWGITLDGPTGIGNSATNGMPDVVSNNTIFNNGGGVGVNQCGDNACGVADYFSITNNVIINNGVNMTAPGAGRFGISYDHVSGTHTLVTNNMLYGNLPANYSTAYNACSVGGTGCPPAANNATDANSGATFTNFQQDTNTSPASGYSMLDYRLKSTSNAVNHGVLTCATGGISPCVPTIDILGVFRPQGVAVDSGAFEQ